VYYYWPAYYYYLKGSPSEHIWDEASVWCRWWWEL